MSELLTQLLPALLTLLVLVGGFLVFQATGHAAEPGCDTPSNDTPTHKTLDTPSKPVYNSQQACAPTRKPPAKTPVKKATKATAPDDTPGTKALKVAELKELLAAEGLPTTGTKAVLERLEQHEAAGKPKKVVRWTPEEEAAFVRLVEMEGQGNWTRVLSEGHAAGVLDECRSPVNLKVSWLLPTARAFPRPPRRRFSLASVLGLLEQKQSIQTLRLGFLFPAA